MRAARRAGALAALAAFGALAPSSAAPQAYTFRPRTQWELRADAFAAPEAAAQLGVGVNVPAGLYARIGVAVAGGAARRDDRTTAGARVDLTARYLLDPFKEFRWGPYGGGGLTARSDAVGKWRGALLVLIGLEGPVHGRWATALELGLGGGARIGVVVRRARANGR